MIRNSKGVSAFRLMAMLMQRPSAFNFDSLRDDTALTRSLPYDLALICTRLPDACNGPQKLDTPLRNLSKGDGTVIKEERCRTPERATRPA